MESQEILEQIAQADMLLVGLGEEFDAVKRLWDDAGYQNGRTLLTQDGHEWLVPMWNEYCLRQLGENPAVPVLKKLAGILKGRNYYVVSATSNSAAETVFGTDQRFVAPCGNMRMKQCERGCEGELTPLTEEDSIALETFFENLYNSQAMPSQFPELGKCSHCGQPMVLNNVFSEHYNENGYLQQWQLYTKWLQGTLKHSLFLLELGVGMQFPTVIRWPFEKIAAYNEKAFLCRIHEKLYQLPQELAGKGCGISENAIDWLEKL